MGAGRNRNGDEFVTKGNTICRVAEMGKQPMIRGLFRIQSVACFGLLQLEAINEIFALHEGAGFSLIGARCHELDVQGALFGVGIAAKTPLI